MKKLLYLTVFIWISINSYSQLQYFLPRTDAYFSVLDKRFVFDGDTTINDLRYTKVLFQHGYEEDDFSEPRYYAAVREDTISGKIYCIQYNDGIERLLADFNVEAGDEVTVYSFWPDWQNAYPTESTVKVRSVDTIEINGEKRKKINIDNGFEDGEWADYWIEGIGSIHGLFAPSPSAIADAGSTPFLLCVYVSGELFWQNPEYSTCYLKDGGAEIENINTINSAIYPTLTKDYLQVKRDLSSYKYNIFTTEGILAQSGVADEIIMLSSLVQGSYIITFYDENNNLVYTGRFIKQ